jgi:hypothetical protein
LFEKAYPTIANVFPMISKYGQLPHIFNLLVHISEGKHLFMLNILRET